MPYMIYCLDKPGHAHVRADNRAALELYGKLGFVESGRLPGYYEDGAEALRMRLELVNAPATGAGSAHLAPNLR